jgi:endonuclease/exonuclease/phosphatase family metal-dependent hydrolase
VTAITAVTYNVFHCAIPETGKYDYNFYANTIKKHNGDFVCLQEMRVYYSGVNQVQKLASLAGYPYWKFGKAMKGSPQNDYGNGILSKYELSSVDVHDLGGDGDSEPRCLLAATITKGGKKIRIGSTHISGGDAAGLVQAKEIKEIVLENRAFQYPVLIGGDFNHVPTSPVGKVLDSVLDFTRTSGIDHILCRGPWKRISQVKVEDGNGDHDPVVGKFEIA